MSALFWETITPDMRTILGEFTRSDLGTKFYLAGGTALALQLGHRLSVDFETQTVKRLVYFEDAEADPDPKLLSPAGWQQVKDYFVQLSKQIAGDWLA